MVGILISFLFNYSEYAVIITNELGIIMTKHNHWKLGTCSALNYEGLSVFFYKFHVEAREKGHGWVGVGMAVTKKAK